MSSLRRTILAVLTASFAILPLWPATAQDGDRAVEVVKLEGILDGVLERALTSTIARAERSGAEAVVVQIDSRGVLGTDRAERMLDAVATAGVPVVTWVGPPGASAENGAAALALSGHVVSMSPGARIGPARVVDLSARSEQPRAVRDLLSSVAARRQADPAAIAAVAGDGVFLDEAEDLALVDVAALQLPDLLTDIAGERVELDGGTASLRTDPDDVAVRFHKADLFGRMLHAVSKPSIAYLLLLLGLVGVVFEFFHPSTGPSGASGAVALALAGYGIATLDGSWVAVLLIVLGVVAFSVDLYLASLWVLSLAGFAGLVAGSLLLFSGPWLRVSPWVLGIGILGMTLFMVTVMTRVLTDLRAIARGELEVREAHPE